MDIYDDDDGAVKKIQGELIWKIKSWKPGVLLVLIFLLISFWNMEAANDQFSIVDNMIPKSDSIVWWNEYWDYTASQDGVDSYIKDTIFALFYIIAVWVFIYLGIQLVSARWNAEEFKKALMGFVYAAI